MFGLGRAMMSNITYPFLAARPTHTSHPLMALHPLSTRSPARALPGCVVLVIRHHSIFRCGGNEIIIISHVWRLQLQLKVALIRQSYGAD